MKALRLQLSGVMAPKMGRLVLLWIFVLWIFVLVGCATQATETDLSALPAKDKIESEFREPPGPNNPDKPGYECCMGGFCLSYNAVLNGAHCPRFEYCPDKKTLVELYNGEDLSDKCPVNPTSKTRSNTNSDAPEG